MISSAAIIPAAAANTAPHNPPMPIGRPTEVPASAAVNDSRKSPIPAPQTFNDPFHYCKMFGNVDQPGRRYIGPKLVEQIAAAFDSTLADNPTIYWRCMDGALWACQPGNGSFCSRVTDNSAHIKTDARGFSSQAWREVSAADKPTAIVTPQPAISGGATDRFKWDFDTPPATPPIRPELKKPLPAAARPPVKLDLQ
jgi:hypothetical protein